MSYEKSIIVEQGKAYARETLESGGSVDIHKYLGTAYDFACDYLDNMDPIEPEEQREVLGLFVGEACTELLRIIDRNNKPN